MSENEVLLDKISFLVGDRNILLNSSNIPAFPIFSNDIVDFLSDLSRELVHMILNTAWAEVFRSILHRQMFRLILPFP